MKAKEKKQLIEKICNECNPNDEALAAIYTTRKRGDYYAIGDMELIANAVKAILLDGSEDKNHPAYPLAVAIMNGVYDAVDDGLDLDFAMFDDEDEDDEDCDTCELLTVCDNERAIQWRKSLGIPRPKNTKSKKRNVEVN